MTARTVLFRRSVMTAAAAGGMAWLGGRASLFTGLCGRVRAASGSEALADLCTGLRASPAIGEACLQALPELNSRESLAASILGDVASSGATFPSARALARQIRERSRDDFRAGRIATVDGWVFSLTETRLYALARMLAET